MRSIRSIVVFNSATAGDFLTSLCWSQLQLASSLFQQEDSGRMKIDNYYFKNLTTKMFYDPAVPVEIDKSQVFPVENSHYWLECYKTIADQSVFIDYPEHVQTHLMQLYLEKVFNNDKQKMLERNLPYQNPYIAKKITVDNLEKILNIHWQKNIQAWRNNPNMSAIYLSDFFDSNKIQRIVSNLIQQDVIDQDGFDQIYNNWILRNSKLSALF